MSTLTSNKYPRIPHLPWSPGGTNDDKRLKTVWHLISKKIVITEKMDGSNLCMTRDAVYARSHSGPPTHKSFDLAKALHAQIRDKLDPGVSIWGEWCYAVHSIEYTDLPGYFLVFGHRWDHKKVPIEFKMTHPPGPFWWSHILTEIRARQLHLPTVPILWKGVVGSPEELEKLTNDLAHAPSAYGGEREGVVVRQAREFVEKGRFTNEIDFSLSVAKWVRSDHPKEPDDHWMFKPIRKQGLRNA